MNEITKQKKALYDREYRESPRGKYLWQERHKKYRERLVTEALLYYGGKCACCGYSDLTTRLYGRRFLEFDHVNGLNGKERKFVGWTMARWLKQNHYPEGYRILCSGCNHAMPPGAKRCLLHGNVIK